jgi:FixJ family two-component response regulator
MPISLECEAHRPRLLLVEDDAAVRRSLQLMLQSKGYDVRAYRTGQGLQNDPEAMRASCLIADLVIPGGDGLSLLQDLRARGWNGKAILISGHLTDEWAGRALDQGYDAVLPKPIPDNVLTKWVARLAPLDGAAFKRSRPAEGRVR